MHDQPGWQMHNGCAIVFLVFIMCLVNRGHVNYMPAGYYDDEGDDNEEPVVSFTFNGPDYYSAVNDGVTLTSIFQVFVVSAVEFLLLKSLAVLDAKFSNVEVTIIFVLLVYFVKFSFILF